MNRPIAFLLGSLALVGCSSGSGTGGPRDAAASADSIHADAQAQVHDGARPGADGVAVTDAGPGASDATTGDTTIPGRDDGPAAADAAADHSAGATSDATSSASSDSAADAPSPTGDAFAPRDGAPGDGLPAAGDATRAPDLLPDGNGADAAANGDAAADTAAPDSSAIPTCGDGIVQGDETCDVALSAGEPGACPTVCYRTAPCQPRQLAGSGCKRICEDSSPITAVSSTADMCCAGTGDPDCFTPYPVGAGDSDVMSEGLNACSTGLFPPWDHESEVSVYLPLGPTCGVPVLVTIDGETPGNGRRDSASARVAASYISAPKATSGWVGLDHDTFSQTSFLVGMAPAEPAFVTATYTDYACTSTAMTTSALFDARPFTGIPVPAASGAPRRVRVAGDHVAQFLVVEHAPAGSASTVAVTSGSYVPVRWVKSSPSQGAEPSSFAVLETVTVSAPGAAATDPTIAVQPTAQADSWTSGPFAHVAWVEDGTDLKYARVGADGTVANPRTVARGTAIRSPQIIVFDDQVLAVTWSEVTGDRSRIKLGYLQMSTGSVASIVDVTLGEGDAVEPALGSAFGSSTWRAGIAWIDSRSGSRGLLFREIQRSGSLAATIQVASDAAVEPSEPAVLAGTSYTNLVWTDRRDGQRALFVKQSTASTPFGAAPELRLSPAGEDAHHVRVAQATPKLEATGKLARSGDGALRVLFERGESGNRVRYVDASTTGTTLTVSSGTDSMPLSCEQETWSPDVSLLDSNLDAPTTSGLRLGAWIEGTTVMIQSLNVPAVGRKP